MAARTVVVTSVTEQIQENESTRREANAAAPGTYSLEPLDEAARVAVDLIDGARWIINLLDSSRRAAAKESAI